MKTSDSLESSDSSSRAGDGTDSVTIHTTGEALRPLEVLVANDVAAVIATIGRTEDIAVSPDGTRLLVAGFERNVLALITFETDSSDRQRPVIELTGVTLVTNARLAQPHGVDFIDDSTILVANRASEVLIMDVPAPGSGRLGAHNHRSAAKVLLDQESPVPVRTPGSLAVRRFGDLAEVVVCNNYVHDVTRHVIDLTDEPAAVHHELLIDAGLQIPDGVAISASGKWLAISNHVTNEVLIYRYDEHLQPDSSSCGQLSLVNYPHGLRFSADDRHLLVADAGLPYVNVYHAENGDWSGVHRPARVARLMDDDTFNRGRYNPQEGGPKGLAFASNDVVVVTSEHQHLGFFSRHDLFAGPMKAIASPGSDHSFATRAARRLADATATIAQLQRRLDEAEATCSALAAAHQEMTETQARVVEQLAERDAQLARCEASCDTLRTEFIAAAEQHTDQLRELLAANAELSERADDAVSQHEAGRVEAEQVAARAVADADAIAGSTAWRLTGPARATLDAVRRLRTSSSS